MADTPGTPLTQDNAEVTTAKPRSIRVDDPLWDAFRAATAEQGEDASAFLRRAMRAYVVDPHATEAALANVRGGAR